MAKTSQSDKSLEARLRWMLGDEKDLAERMTRDQWNAPHVFIGIGGTGTQAVTRIAGRLKEMISEGDGAAGMLPACLQFVAIDTDSSELSAQVRRAGVEVIDLTVSDPEVVWSENSEAFESLGYDEPIRIELGAGGRRKFGRFAFAAHSERIKQIINSALAESQGYAGLDQNRDPRVHVFFSLAGGTGCGTFLDLAFLIRDLTANMVRTNVDAYVVVPDNIVAVVNTQTMASAAAALKELEYFMQLERGAPAFKGWGNAPRHGDRISYWKGARVRGHVRRPFDFCYLFGSVGEGQGSVSRTSDFPGVLAEAAIRNAFSSAGEWNRRRSVDVQHHFSRDWQGKFASFSMLGYSRLVLPTSELGAYLTLELAEGLCDYLLDGPQGSTFQSDSVRALLQTRMQQLTTGVSVDQIVPANRKAAVDSAMALTAFDQNMAAKQYAKVKQACESLPNLFDTVWNDSEKTRREAFHERRDLLRKFVGIHLDDLTVGLHDDVAFFTSLKGRLLTHHAECGDKAEKSKQALDRYLGRMPSLAQFLGRKDWFSWVTRSTNTENLRGGYQLAISGLRDYVLARANHELAGLLVEEIESQINLLVRARDHIINDLKSRFAARRAHFQDRLRQMNFGRGSDDCKTFCPVDLARITEQAERMLQPLQSKFAGLLAHAQRDQRLDLKAMAAGGAKALENTRLAILEILVPEVSVENLWQRLVADADRWEEMVNDCRRRVLMAASPLVRFNTTQPPVVIGTYAGFDSGDLGHFSFAVPDESKFQKRDATPLLPQSGSSEATRFFHGLRLVDLATAKEMGSHYRAYMDDVRKAGAAGDGEDHINLFESLIPWPAPDQGVPKTTEDEPLRLWSLGLMFSEIFPPDKDQKASLNGSAGKGKKDPRNFLYKIGHYYYLQPAYETPAAQAPAPVQLERGRDKAYEVFRDNEQAVAEMRRWYEHADRIWTERFTGPDLQEAVKGYLDGLSGTGALIPQERDVIQAFLSNPFPE